MIEDLLLALSLSDYFGNITSPINLMNGDGCDTTQLVDVVTERVILDINKLTGRS